MRLPFYEGQPSTLRDVRRVDCDRQSGISSCRGKSVYIAGPACSTTVAIDGAMDCIDDDRMTRHTEVIVRSPNTNPFI